MQPIFIDQSGFLRIFLRSILPILAAVVAGGCSSNQGNLRLLSVDQKHEFSQAFTRAYLDRNDAGDADIVLVQDNIEPARQDPSQHLDGWVMPRQLVHIRVFWTPMSGVKADHPANTNASIHWCFICDDANRPGLVEYCGSGLVELDDSSTGASVRIRKAWMKEGCRRGEMVDPLGPSILQGSFHAEHDPAQVRAIMAQIKAAAGGNTDAQVNAVNPGH
ncbi:MAG: hypothetical protein ABSC42_13530 [Tepidisphaeraceae bacterium]